MYSSVETCGRLYIYNGADMGKDKLIYRCFLSCSLLISLIACNQTDEQLLKVGATVGPHAQVIEAVVKEARKQGAQC